MLPSLSNLLPVLLIDIFFQVVQDNGMEEYFKLVRVSSKCREIVKSPLVLQSIKFEELPLREDRSLPVQHFISTLQRYENPDVLYLEGMKLAFGLETDYPVGERMVMQASQLQCPHAMYTECMLNMLKDEVDCEV